jgi:hypothetical protein
MRPSVEPILLDGCCAQIAALRTFDDYAEIGAAEDSSLPRTLRIHCLLPGCHSPCRATMQTRHIRGCLLCDLRRSGHISSVSRAKLVGRILGNWTSLDKIAQNRLGSDFFV